MEASSSAPLHIVVASRAVAPQHGFGGLERAVALKLRHLARRGVRITVFTQPPLPGAPPREEWPGLVPWREIPYRRVDVPLRRNSIPDRLLHYGPFVRTLGRAIADLARRERVDVVHAQGLTAAGYARELRAEGGGQRAEGGTTRDIVPSPYPAICQAPLPPLPSALCPPPSRPTAHACYTTPACGAGRRTGR